MSRELDRGAVYLTDIELPHGAIPGSSGGAVRQKFVVVLQGGTRFAAFDNVAVAVASTFRRQAPRAWEVVVGVAEGFAHDTVIDGRWIYTVLKTDIPSHRYKFTLPAATMNQVSAAIAVGLEL